jgi:hypothetical protein
MLADNQIQTGIGEHFKDGSFRVSGGPYVAIDTKMIRSQFVGSDVHRCTIDWLTAKQAIAL